MTQSQFKRELKKRINQAKKVDYSSVGRNVAKNKKVHIALGVLAAGLFTKLIWRKTQKSPIDKIMSYIK